MASSTRTNVILQPRIPDGLFPIAFKVFVGDAEAPQIPTSRYRSGDIYIGIDDIWIMQSGSWVKWVPTDPMLLNIDNDELYVAPCKTKGLQLVSGIDAHAACCSSTRKDLDIDQSDDMTAIMHRIMRKVLGISVGDASISRIKVHINLAFTINYNS